MVETNNIFAISAEYLLFPMIFKSNKHFSHWQDSP